MGMERGHYSASGGYRPRDYGPRNGGSYNYDKYDKYDSYGNGSLNGKHERDYDTGSKFNGGGREATEQAILGLEKQIVNVKRDMNTAIQEATTKDNEKFDLIFSILTELQRRQASMEESIRGLRQMFGPDGQRAQGGAASSMPQFPKPNMDGSSMAMPPMPLGGQGFMMASGPQMGQQFMAPDGTPMQVVVMSPGQAGQMYGMPQMMPGPLPVPMAAGQFDSNGVVCDFNGAQPTGDQPTTGAGQETEVQQQAEQQSQGADAAQTQEESEKGVTKLGETEAQKGDSSAEKAPHVIAEEE